MAHGALVALAAVTATARAQLAGGDARRARQPARAHGRQRQARAGGTVDRGRVEGVEQADHPVEVVGFELARRIGSSEAQLAGRAQHVRDRGGRAHRQNGASRDGGLELRAVPEAQRERACGQRARELAAQRLRLGEHRRSFPRVCAGPYAWGYPRAESTVRRWLAGGRSGVRRVGTALPLRSLGVALVTCLLAQWTMKILWVVR